MRVIHLTKGASTIVDDADYELLSRWRWKLHPQGYAARTTWNAADKKWATVLMHRLVASTPGHLQADHINRDRLDNRRSNLRNVTPSENTWNQPLKSKQHLGCPRSLLRPDTEEVESDVGEAVTRAIRNIRTGSRSAPSNGA